MTITDSPGYIMYMRGKVNMEHRLRIYKPRFVAFQMTAKGGWRRITPRPPRLIEAGRGRRP